jgi:hypothetical protein
VATAHPHPRLGVEGEDITWEGERWWKLEGFRIATQSYLCWRPRSELVGETSTLDLSRLSR